MNPIIILGPPGTGKTTTLLGMVEQDIAMGVEPDRIGYFSFTTKAADEAAGRAMKRFELKKKDLPWFRTLHSMCFKRLNMNNGDVFGGYAVMTEFAQYAKVRVSTRKQSLTDDTNWGFEEGDRILFMENLSRVKRIPLHEQYRRDADDLRWVKVQYVADCYAAFKKARHLYDFTDMLQMFVDSDAAPDLDVIYIDEAQDLSKLQWDVVHKLAERAKKVVIAGDDDQAIYRWAGADVDYFVQLKGRAQVLGQSWRVPGAVQQVASGIISRVSNRRPKDWKPRPEEGVVADFARLSQVDLSGEDILILIRNTLFANAITDYLRKEGILFADKYGNKSVPESLVSAIYTWEQLRQGKEVDHSDAKKLYEFFESRTDVKHGHKQLPGIPPDTPVTMTDLVQRGGLLVNPDLIWHEALRHAPADQIAYILKCRQNGEKLRQVPRVRLSTIHGAKGAEAEHVILFQGMAQRTHQEMMNNMDDERRVWYVAVTRAKQQLSIISPNSNCYFPL